MYVKYFLVQSCLFLQNKIGPLHTYGFNREIDLANLGQKHDFFQNKLRVGFQKAQMQSKNYVKIDNHNKSL